MLGLDLNHASKRAPRWTAGMVLTIQIVDICLQWEQTPRIRIILLQSNDTT